MIEVKNMSESDILYRLEQVKDQIKECRRRIEKYNACIKRNEEEGLRLMREEIVLKQALKDINKGEKNAT